ncbi:MAG: hypothetical protein GDA44_03095 [Prochloron sp. SP5CPC1]|nr:hypothetical protein [Candidatus Paraprochloron terpiosi SP5CPC1]
MSEQEQNAKINKLQRQLVNAVKRIKTLELDVEPEEVSEGFTVLEKHMDERFDHLEARINRMEKQYNSRFDRMEHQFNRLQGKLEVILDAITGISDLPEDETEEI